MAQASSSNSQSRAQLIREMSRDYNRTRHSSDSSRNSQGNASLEPTLSDFDPENEALMSTRQFDTLSQRLPELRASAQKYNRFARQERPEPDFAINTSALGRAFPDFSSGGTSDGSSMSIEVGRGHKNSLGRSREYSPNPPASVTEDSLDFKAPVVGSYQVVSTPPIRQRSTSMKKDDSTALRREAHVRRASLNRKQQFELLKKTSQEVLRNHSQSQKENMDPSPPLAKTTDYVSGGSGRKSGEERRTLAAMHARVRDEDDLSKVDDERPPTIDLTGRSARFGSGRNQPKQESLPSKFSSTREFMQNTIQRKSSEPNERPQANGTLSPTPNPGTQQSFALPDMPNLSELVSGVFHDGTPVFSRHSKSRASRFASSHAQEAAARGLNHAAVSEIPVPDEENAIFISLRLLQEKVAELEKDRAETQNTIQDLRHENQMLEAEKAERRRRQRSDSALGSSDSGSDGDERSSARKLVIEKNRLASSVRSLQSQLDISNRKASTFETVVNNMTKERDSAVSQLGVAYVTIEQLKSENHGLAKENRDLKNQVNYLTASHENETQGWTIKEDDLKRQIQQTKQSIRHLEEMSTNMFNERKSTNDPTFGKGPRNATKQFGLQEPDTQHSLRIPKRSRFANKSTDQGTQNPETLTSRRPRNISESRTQQKTKDLLRGIGPADNDETFNSQDSDEFLDLAREEAELSRKSEVLAEPTLSRSAKDVRGDDTSQDLTYLSFLKSEEVGKLRKTLENERIARKEQCAPLPPKPITRDDMVADVPLRTPATVPLKPSMKDGTRRSLGQVERTEQSMQASAKTQEVLPERCHHEKMQTPNVFQNTRPKTSGGEYTTRRHSEPPVPTSRGRSRSVGVKYPFILPDISLEIPGIVSQPSPELSRAREVFSAAKEHDIRSCTVCKNIIERGIDHEHNEPTTKDIKIPKLIPVSQRMPEATHYEDEPTIRPSQSPATALAAVVKGLSDEHSHLVIQHSHYRSLYFQIDPSMKKTQRKELWAKMSTLMNAMEVKANQIYDLYDVLEGQKADGTIDLTEHVEETLQSVGIDLVELGLRGGAASVQQQNLEPSQRQPWDLESNENITQDLPWEGIESTVETSKSNQTGSRRKSWNVSISSQTSLS